MLVLNATTDTLEAVLAGAITTNQLVCYSSYRDITTTAYTPGRNHIPTNNTTDVVILSSPAASTQRVCDYLSIFNRDTVAATVTIKFDALGVETELWKGSLAVGEKVEYVEGEGFRVLDNTGVVKGIGATGAAGINGGGTVLGSGTSIIDFGAGSSHTSLVVTGEAAILAGSLVYCWLKPEATADHSADEHLVETIKVYAADVVAGVGFTIHALNTSETFEPSQPIPSLLGRSGAPFTAPGRGQAPRNLTNTIGGKGTFITGEWSVGWIYTQ